MDMQQIRQAFPHVKPNSLVYVDLMTASGYAYVGEVMSYPTPDSHAMVRRVPGHPGTLEELPLSVLRHAEHGRKTVHYAVVCGGGSFPVDMLRYDCAAPVNFRLVEGGYTTVELLPEFADFTKNVEAIDERRPGPLVIATTRIRSRHEAWTKARWASFNWSIRTLCSEDYPTTTNPPLAQPWRRP